jgi:hypothetical protein
MLSRAAAEALLLSAGVASLVAVAFTIGMTFQVSDTDLAKRPIRRAALH